MYVGEIVYLPIREGFVKYVIKKMVDDDILVISFKSKEPNWLNKSDVISLATLKKIYNNEEIYG